MPDADVAFSPDSRSLLAVDRSGRAAIWDLDRGKRTPPRGAMAGEGSGLLACDRLTGCGPWSPDSRSVAGASAASEATVWDAGSGASRSLGVGRATSAAFARGWVPAGDRARQRTRHHRRSRRQASCEGPARRGYAGGECRLHARRTTADHGRRRRAGPAVGRGERRACRSEAGRAGRRDRRGGGIPRRRVACDRRGRRPRGTPVRQPGRARRVAGIRDHDREVRPRRQAHRHRARRREREDLGRRRAGRSAGRASRARDGARRCRVQSRRALRADLQHRRDGEALGSGAPDHRPRPEHEHRWPGAVQPRRAPHRGRRSADGRGPHLRALRVLRRARAAALEPGSRSADRRGVSGVRRSHGLGWSCRPGCSGPSSAWGRPPSARTSFAVLAAP